VHGFDSYTDCVGATDVMADAFSAHMERCSALLDN